VRGAPPVCSGAASWLKLHQSEEMRRSGAVSRRIRQAGWERVLQTKKSPEALLQPVRAEAQGLEHSRTSLVPGGRVSQLS